ncbi:hypothetical protein Rumeso_04081 [Rubellimicrobium mesophilum DSM 19309]|uniref:Helicase ATP-binding domain-containing protein n=1 Tax=Rubellimicrobium mesophilum DSM 19309 TaxID=442562 RepID=A0A017HJ65_9RHOB|nr:SNF2-related protein [Rubellimicrobium mesophilum]EYD74396.1 hypothetical protein Rumeso_04081 [Rubellimicrobium mesophilum DSM 19309]
MSVDWSTVAERLREIADAPGTFLNEGQRDSLCLLAERLPQHGVILADEVGLGKTRIAVAAARAVTEAGGRVAILIPTTLAYQWQDEFKKAGFPAPGEAVRSFWQFIGAWSDPSAPRPWFDRSVVLLSHGLVNWRLHPNGPRQRTQLLPALVGLAQRSASGRAPNGFPDFERNLDPSVRTAAHSIWARSAQGSPEMMQRLDALRQETTWRDASAAQDFEANGGNRRRLHQAVGLGLGAFDLVIVDEAHKSRHDESGLSRLLGEVLLGSSSRRHLCLTATPVELNAGQWVDSLARAGVRDDTTKNRIRGVTSRYAKSLARLRHAWRSSPDARQEFSDAARAFQEALSPFVLRRDKRRDEDVVRYRQAVLRNRSAALHEPLAADVDSYRWQHEIPVDLSRLDPSWKRAVCAVEALSFVSEMGKDPLSKRLRLTFGNGHGIASGLDHAGQEEVDPTLALDGDPEGIAASDPEAVGATSSEGGPPDKRAQRISWWKGVLAQVGGRSDPLFEHPAIVAAAREIDDYATRGEKVLVFGRFTAPMRALVALLNARQMLRALDEGRLWPQSQVAQEDRSAVEAAHRQLGRPDPFDLGRIDAALAAQYLVLERRRGRLRQKIFDLIGEGLRPDEPGAAALLAAARRTDRPTHLAAAIEQLLGERVAEPSADTGERPAAAEFPPRAVAESFIDLVSALRDQGRDALDLREPIDEDKALAVWSDTENRLEVEYRVERGALCAVHVRLDRDARPAGAPACVQPSRKQPARPRGPVARRARRPQPAQGLPCRRPHPPGVEPGVVEQQIGRVDRVASHWAASVQRALETGEGTLPRIEIRPVIFGGTYDAHHWAVLLDRWDDLRAQLHGIVIPHHDRTGCTEEEIGILTTLDEAAPDFSPPPRRQVSQG